MVNFICLSNSKNEYIKSLTQTCIESIRRALHPKENKLDCSRIIVIESNKEFNSIQDKLTWYKNAITIPFDFTKYGKFNYNYALNLGIDYCKENYNDNDWYCFINNDLIFDINWLVAIRDASIFDKDIESFCCNLNRKPEKMLKCGYATFVNLDGCCILCKSSVLDKIGKFDETFDFYFQDDDYCEQLRMHGIKHVKVMNSMLLHVASQTVTEGSDMKLLFDGRDKFIAKYGMQTYLRREREKYSQ